MALVKPGPLVTAISGTVGGVTFAQGRRSTIARPNPPPLPNASTKQRKRQAEAYNVVREWQNLTDAQRAAWTAAGASLTVSNRIGTRAPLSGYNYFRRLNILNAMEGLILRDVIQAPDVADQPLNPVLSITAGPSMDIDFDNSAPYVANFIFYGALHYRSTPTTTLGPFTYLGSEASLLSNSVPLTDIWESVFPFPQVGQFYAIKMVPFDHRSLPGAPFYLSDLR